MPFDLKSAHMRLAHQWVCITEYDASLAKLLDTYEGDHLFGYIYIDHTHGLTLDIAQLFDRNDDRITPTFLASENGIRLICRFAHFIRSGSITVINDSDIEKHGLKRNFQTEAYDRKDLNFFRSEAIFHRFRAEGFPDDIQLLFLSERDLQPEFIWMRVEAYDDRQQKVSGELLNQPNQDWEVNQGDQVEAQVRNMDGSYYIVAILPSQGNPTKKRRKKWWNFRSKSN